MKKEFVKLSIKEIERLSKKDREKYFEQVRKFADKGNPAAQCLLGRLYAKRLIADNNVSRVDGEKARRLFSLAAGQGYVEAQYRLAEWYADESPLRTLYHCTDYAKAYEWYEKAALNGHLCAMYKVARCYYDGRGVEKNIPECIEWYKKFLRCWIIDGDYDFTENADNERILKYLEKLGSRNNEKCVYALYNLGRYYDDAETPDALIRLNSYSRACFYVWKRLVYCEKQDENVEVYKRKSFEQWQKDLKKLNKPHKKFLIFG